MLSQSDEHCGRVKTETCLLNHPKNEFGIDNLMIRSGYRKLAGVIREFFMRQPIFGCQSKIIHASTNLLSSPLKYSIRTIIVSEVVKYLVVILGK